MNEIDPVGRNQQLFTKIDEEISAFINTFKEQPIQAVREMDKLSATASEIGGSLLQDVLKLEADYQHYLINHKPHTIIQDALRIKHEAREI